MSGHRIFKGLLGMVIFLPVFCVLGPGTVSWAVSEGQDVASSQGQVTKQDKLWADAQAFLGGGDTDQAALYFKHYWKTYPQSHRAAEALWQAALLYKQQALLAHSPDWLRVRDLFQAYLIDFSGSPRVAEAYYEIGNSYFQMGFYREAHNYYTLLLKEYPATSLKNEVNYMRGRAFLYEDKFSLASAEFAKLLLSRDKAIRLRGENGQVEIHFVKGEWHDALGILKRLHRQNPDYYLVYPKILKDMGIATIRVGDVQGGREHILHYLNIREQDQVDGEAYFEVAESFLQDGMVDGARIFYELVVAKADPGDKYTILSKFRLAQYGAFNIDTMSAKERLAFFKRDDDRPFQEVLDNLYRDPLAQDARYSLFLRYLERQEWDLAYNLGKAYLRHKAKPKEQLVVVEEELGNILIGKITGLIKAKKYANVLSLYKKEFATIAAYKKADLLMVIGEAYELQSLYDQASVIYYRALGLEIGEEQKAKLYFRRAEVYLANNDLKSAQKLLKYLRRLYQDQAAIAEVNWLSGRLRDMQMRPGDALVFYRMAVESGGGQDKKGIYAADYLHHLFAQNDLDRVADLVAMFHDQQWLPAQRIQYWYGRLGLELSQKGEKKAAAAIYKRALAEGLPEDSPEAQPIHLHLGDLLMAQKSHKEALAHYRLAQAGQDKRVAQLAQARLNGYQISGAMAEVEAML